MMTGSHVGSAAVTSRANDEVVLGVDTHKDAHVVVVLSGTGVLLETCSFPTTAAGYQQMIAWARSFATLKVAGVEGTGSYGAGLNRALRAAGVHVIEVNRPDRAARRRRGKTDAVDAESAARAVLSGEAAALAKTGDGPVEDIRVLKVVKDSAVKARVQAINQLKAILVSSDPALREQLSTLNTRQLVQRCAGLEDGVGSATVVYVLATPGATHSVAGRRNHCPAATDHDCGHRDSTTAHGGDRHRSGRRSHPARDGRRQSAPPDHRGRLRRPMRRQPG